MIVFGRKLWFARCALLNPKNPRGAGTEKVRRMAGGCPRALPAYFMLPATLR